MQTPSPHLRITLDPQNLALLVFLILACEKCDVLSLCGLICISLITNNANHLFIFLFHYQIAFWKSVCESFVQVSTGLFAFFLLSSESSLNSEYSLLMEMYLQIFPAILWFIFFLLLIVSFFIFTLIYFIIMYWFCHTLT